MYLLEIVGTSGTVSTTCCGCCPGTPANILLIAAKLGGKHTLEWADQFLQECWACGLMLILLDLTFWNFVPYPQSWLPEQMFHGILGGWFFALHLSDDGPRHWFTLGPKVHAPSFQELGPI